MAKPATFDGYSDQYTLDCERVLVTLLRGLGPWKNSQPKRQYSSGSKDAIKAVTDEGTRTSAQVISV